MVEATECDDGRLEIEANRRSKRLFPRIEFHDELPEWITSSDQAAYGPLTRTIYVATAGHSKLLILLNLLHELGHHLIELVSGKPSRHFKYDDICEWAGDRIDRILLRRK